MLKRLLLVITTITVLFAFVTYQPKKVDANGVSTVVSFAAKQALRTATKSAVNDTIGSLALKTATQEVAEQYVKKEGMKLVVLEGGKKVMAKTALTTTEKNLLKKEIDNVIDLKMYGNSPKWVKFLDWFVGIGTVVLVGQILVATINGDFSDFISEIFNEAMTNLGWLVTPQKVTDPTPSNPVDFPSSSPSFDLTQTNTPNFSNINISATHVYNVSTNQTGFIKIPLKLPYPQYQQGSIFYMELQPTTSSGFGRVPFWHNQIHNSAGYFGDTPLKHDIYKDTISASYATSAKVMVGGKLVYDKVFSPSQNVNFDMKSLVGFDFKLNNYNRLIMQNQVFVPELDQYISRYILQDTYLNRHPDVYIQTTFENKGFDKSRIFDGYAFELRLTDPADVFPFKVKIGYFRDLNLALDTKMLPKPTLNPADVKIPIVSQGTLYVPNPSMFPEGYVYNPSDQTIRDPQGNPVTDPSTIPEKNPDPVTESSPDGELIIDGVPTGQPAPSPVTPPNGGGGSEVTGGDPKDINWDKLKAVPAIFTKKFPFSLPWDAKRFIDGVLGGVPQAKDIVVKLDEIGGVHIGMNITLPDFFDTFFSFTRTMTLIIFDIGLIFGLYRLLGGAS